MLTRRTIGDETAGGSELYELCSVRFALYWSRGMYGVLRILCRVVRGGAHYSVLSLHSARMVSPGSKSLEISCISYRWPVSVSVQESHGRSKDNR